MLKWIGACLAASACVTLGFALASSLHARARALGEALRALRLLSRRISALSEPMRDALEALEGESPFLDKVLSAMREMPSIAWELALKNTRELNAQDAAVVLRIVAESGGAGRADQQGIYDAGLAQLGERERAARDKAANDARLCRTLGLIAAAVVLLLAI